MKFDSPIYDRIRVKPDEDRRLRAKCPACEWPGCAGAATHRAPKGRTRANEYWRFCLEHVREYNHSYNFFAGMSDEAVARYQKDALTGHRPTWKLGMSGGRRARVRPFEAYDFGIDDPFETLGDVGSRGGAQSEQHRAQAEARTLRSPERQAFYTLGLDEGATRVDIKARFKMLVKRHHPDANGGDRTSEDKLREIIQAYNYLKSAKLC